MDGALSRLILKTAKEAGADYAEARIEEAQSSAFMLKNGVPHISGYDLSVGVGIRVQARGMMSFASTNILEHGHVRDLVNRTIEAAKRAGPGTSPYGEGKAYRGRSTVKQRIDVRDVSPAQKLRFLRDIDEAVQESRYKVPGRWLMLADSYTRKWYENSEGSKIISATPHTNFTYINTIKGKGRQMQRYWQYGFAGGYELLYGLKLPGLLKDEVDELGKTIEHGATPPKGKIDVVIGPQIVGIVAHESAGHPGEADRVLGREAAQAGESFLGKHDLGKRVGSEQVTIIDDPAVPNSFGFYAFDDEGIPAQKRFLYDKGKVSAFLHNRESAPQMRTKSNGSARASGYDREPIVRMANTYLTKGDYSERELIEGVKSGIYMKSFMEWNIDDRRYNQKYVGAQSYLIKDGKLAGPVWQPILEMTTPRLYSSIDAKGKDIEFHAGTCGKGEPMQGIPVWFGGPAARLRDVRLGNP